jgi:L-arabinose transport system ATP-binding protein
MTSLPTESPAGSADEAAALSAQAPSPASVFVDDAQPYLQLDGITVRFPGVLALDQVSLEVRRGEVHGLMGENGAGK